MQSASASEQLAEVLQLLTPVLDIVRAPLEEPEPPEFCRKRGWADFLGTLTDTELAACEARGLESGLHEHPGAPPDFRALFREVRRVTQVARLPVVPMALPPGALRGVPARKREQLADLLGAVSALAAHSQRIVDVGAGSGHFARLASELFGRETVALDREQSRLRTGTERSEQRARDNGELDIRFVLADLFRESLGLKKTDLAVGLHACGELGDRLVLAAGAARCALALVSCCLQKTRADVRVSLSRSAAEFRLHKADLGLTNLTLQAEGVEAPLADNLRGREVRLAVRHLLRERGIELRPGEEMRGVNRRRAQAGFPALASRVLAVRGLPAPTESELAFHAQTAAGAWALIRRFSLPRNLLARLVELSVVLDRAALLEECGLRVQVAQLFEQRVTPRNLVVLAGGAD
jgi:SAM-dependent methyltransferase